VTTRRTLDPSLFEPQDRVAILGTDITATVIERSARQCAACGTPIWLLCSDDEGDRFTCCEPAMKRLHAN
jgi:hypothetical protein